MRRRTWTRTPRTDLGHNLTERELGELQARVEEIYKQCAADMTITAEEYFDTLNNVRVKKMLEKVKDGTITQDQYNIWLKAQIGRGKNFEEMRDRLALRMGDAANLTNEMIRDTMPRMYAVNRNFAAYTIEQVSDFADFALWDEHTVKRLLLEKPDLMPHFSVIKAIDKGYNMAYCRAKITDVVTSGILRGLSIDDMAKNLVGEVNGMEMRSAIRAVRTATTAAENAGRLDGFEEAEELGIDMEKEWMATLDSRTRHSHQALDGVHVPVKESFPNGCAYPADPRGAASEVYNCRCTLVAWFPELKAQNDARMTYSKWLNRKKAAAVSSQNTGKVVKYNERYDYSINIDRYSDEVNQTLSEKARTFSEYSDKNGVEVSGLINVSTGKLVQSEIGEDNMTGTKFYDYLETHLNDKFVFLHTHVYDGSLSAPDIEILLSCDSIDCMIACRNDSVMYIAPKKQGAELHKFLYMKYGDEPEQKLVEYAIRDYVEGYSEKDGRI